MPSKIQDFINTYKGLAELQQNRDQIEDARENAKVAGINTFMTLARQTAEPAQLTMLVDRFAQLGVGSREQLLGILQNVTPTTEALTGQQTAKGIEVQNQAGKGDQLASETASTQLTGQNQGQNTTSQLVSDLTSKFKLPQGPMGDAIIAAAGARAIGATPGQLILDHALSQLPFGTLKQGAGISLGTEISPIQRAGLDYNWAGLRETARHNRQSESLQEVGLGIEADANAAKNRAAGRPDASNVASLIATKASIIKELTSTKDTPTQNLIMNYIGALNAINQQLTSANVPNEGPIQYDAAALVDPSAWEALKRRIAGIKTNVQYSPSGTPRQKR